jgi:periplasmic divalent cation tolerance protein
MLDAHRSKAFSRLGGKPDVVDILQVVTATDSQDEANRLANDLVTEKLAASTQVDGPIQSVYWWQGKVVRAEEWRVVLKTAADRYQELETFILEHHSYDTPGILATRVCNGSDKYMAWIVNETRPRSS